MKRSIFSRFVSLYILVGIFNLLVVIVGGSYLVDYYINSAISKTGGITASGKIHVMEILFLIFVIMYTLIGLCILFYYMRIHKPLEKIVDGTVEYANGNLKYKIPIETEDEFGYLAQSLNYMADKLNKNGEYQSSFIANVSHDFRSPLTSIKGYVEAMLDGTIPPELHERYLKIIDSEAQRLEKLTRNLLTLNDIDVKKRMLNKKRFDINHTIASMAETFEGICNQKKIKLSLLLSGKQLYVNADMDQIQQVLYNLLDNAIKYSGENTMITVETTEKNGKAFISVKDQGCGIPKESIPKIWERFYKLDSSRGKDRKGSGLGLSIVKEIINSHDQHINVISTEGVGTEFIFSLEKIR